VNDEVMEIGLLYSVNWVMQFLCISLLCLI